MLEKDNGKNVRAILMEIVKSSAEAAPLLDEFQIKKPKKSVIDFLNGFQQTLDLSQETLVSGLVLLKRISLKGVRITQKLLFKLMIVCLLLSEKIYSDEEYSIEDFSLASGVPIADLAKLEFKIVSILDYNLIISEREYYEVVLCNDPL